MITLVAAVLAIGLVTGSANAGPTAQIIAGPGAATTTFTTAKVVMLHGSKAVFHNFDIAPHNVKSTTGLFSSATVGLLGSANVNGVTKLKKGSYNFICTIHPNMKGTLIVK
jgi:plastocyanin